MQATPRKDRFNFKGMNHVPYHSITNTKEFKQDFNMKLARNNHARKTYRKKGIQKSFESSLGNKGEEVDNHDFGYATQISLKAIPEIDQHEDLP